MPESNPKILLPQIYQILLIAYGTRHKWFGDSRDEIIIGAILTQNTNWLNVEKALANLRSVGLLNLQLLAKQEPASLATLIKPAGYHNQKALRLINLALELSKPELPADLAMRRQHYLSLKGIGPETADCILLYADQIPVFVIDAYTIRIFSRLGLCSTKVKYHDLQQWFTANLPTDLILFQEYHTLLIKLAKTSCLKVPRCALCPVKKACVQAWSLVKSGVDIAFPIYTFVSYFFGNMDYIRWWLGWLSAVCSPFGCLD